jgi:hypothetical protein
VKPVGEWTITIRRADGETSKLTLRAEPQTRRDEQNVVYTYTLVGNGKAVYRPGDTLTAELNVKRGERDAKLSWIGSRTSSFQFERFLREPRLHDATLPAADGVSADGLQVQVVEGTWPIVPTLLPSVRLK